MRHQTEWFRMEEPYGSIGFHSDAPTDDLEAYLCPLCGERTEYWEGDIDQDGQENYTRGYTYDCHKCGVHSEVQAFL
jgi:predicted RNA-binding Zn-ribbon protein involved in translation (DUF1610 family)